MATTSSQTMPARPAGPQGGHGAPAPAHGVGRFNPTIDPIRLLKQYWPWLAGAVAAGCVIGAVSHVIFKRVMPLYTATTVLKVSPPPETAEDLGQLTVSKLSSEAEIDRFMYTQVQEIISKRNFAEAARDPTIRNDTAWAKKFVERGTYDESRAARRLEKRVVGARVVPETQYVTISATTMDPKDAVAISQTVAKTYLTRVNQSSSADFTQTMEVMSRQLKNLENEQTTIERRMQRILVDSSIESVEFNLTESSQKMENLSRLQAVIKTDIEDAKERLAQYEQMMTQPGGVSYPDYLRSEVQREPGMYAHAQTLAQFTSALQAARSRFGPNHVEVRRLEASVSATEQTMKQDEQRLLAEKFGALVQFTRETIRANEAKIRELDEEMRAAMTRSGELTRLIEEYSLLKKDSERKGDMKEELNQKIGNLRGLIDREASRRVRVHQAATTPEVPTFPVLKVMIPAGAVLTLGFVAGFIFLREMLEQRVRTPADVAILPRTRVLGVISDVSEDLSAPTCAENAVKERPEGALAEQIRQIRANILRIGGLDGKRVLLLTSGLPGSGTTTIAVNASRLVAALDRRVLLIDANLRRPKVHQVFGMPEGPGLGEALAGAVTLADAARETDLPTLRVLTAGAKPARAYERLNSESMNRLLDEARAAYDLVIVDSPPMTVAGDACVLANRCDASALIVRAFCETRGLVSRVRNQLGESRAEVLGVIVNGVKSAAGGYFRRNIQISHQYGAAPTTPPAAAKPAA